MWTMYQVPVHVNNVPGSCPCEQCTRFLSMWTMDQVPVHVNNVPGTWLCEQCTRFLSMWTMYQVPDHVNNVPGTWPCQQCTRYLSMWTMYQVPVHVNNVPGTCPCDFSIFYPFLRRLMLAFWLKVFKTTLVLSSCKKRFLYKNVLHSNHSWFKVSLPDGVDEGISFETILLVHVFTASRRPLQLSDINVLVSFKVIRFDKLLSLHHILFIIIFNSRDVLRLLINKNSLLFEFWFLQIPKFFCMCHTYSVRRLFLCTSKTAS